MNGTRMSGWVPVFFAALALIAGLVTMEIGVAAVGAGILLIAGVVVLVRRRASPAPPR